MPSSWASMRQGKSRFALPKPIKSSRLDRDWLVVIFMIWLWTLSRLALDGTARQYGSSDGRPHLS